MRNTFHAAWTALPLVATLACGGVGEGIRSPGSEGEVSCTAPPTLVPEPAPAVWLVDEDTARAFFERENLLVDHPRVAGRYPRNLVQVYFASDASAGAKKAAIEAVCGEVVGGNGLYHYVRVHVEAVADPVWWAHDRLRALPQVRDVQPIFFDYTR
jgi:hypothetical protein